MLPSMLPSILPSILQGLLQGVVRASAVGHMDETLCQMLKEGRHERGWEEAADRSNAPPYGLARHAAARDGPHAQPATSRRSGVRVRVRVKGEG